MSLAWGAHANGQISAADMVWVDGALLEPSTARAWSSMVAACLAETGHRLTITEGYRSLATQWAYYRNPPRVNDRPVVVAYPGTSNHGWGRAIDLGGYTAAWSWLQGNAGRFGFSWATGKASGEKWHWEYVGVVTAGGGSTHLTILTEQGEDEMQTILIECLDNLGKYGTKNSKYFSLYTPATKAVFKIADPELANQLVYEFGRRNAQGLPTGSGYNCAARDWEAFHGGAYDPKKP